MKTCKDCQLSYNLTTDISGKEETYLCCIKVRDSKLPDANLCNLYKKRGKDGR